MQINNQKSKLFIEKFPFEYVVISYIAIQKEITITALPFQVANNVLQRLVKWGFISIQDNVIKYVGCPMFSTSKRTNTKLLKNYTPQEIEEDNYVKFAVWFWKKVKQVFKTDIRLDNANGETWINPVRLMVENDKRDLHEMSVLTKKVFEDSFWRVNIRSTDKFREQYAQLQVKLMETPKEESTIVKRKKLMDNSSI